MSEFVAKHLSLLSLDTVGNYFARHRVNPAREGVKPTVGPEGFVTVAALAATRLACISLHAMKSPTIPGWLIVVGDRCGTLISVLFLSARKV